MHALIVGGALGGGSWRQGAGGQGLEAVGETGAFQRRGELAADVVGLLLEERAVGVDDGKFSPLHEGAELDEGVGVTGVERLLREHGYGVFVDVLRTIRKRVSVT